MKVMVPLYYDKKTFIDYYFYLLFKRWPAKILALFFIAEWVVLLVFLIIDFVVKNSFNGQLLLLGALIILVNGVYFLVNYLTALKFYKKQKQTLEIKTYYRFYNSFFTLSIKEEKDDKDLRISYQNISYVKESRKYFWINLLNKRVYLVKKGLINGDEIVKLKELFNKKEFRGKV